VELNRQGDASSCTPPSPHMDVRRVRRCAAELATMAALPPHPLLPVLYDAFASRNGRRAHIVMTHVPGTDLSARLQAADGGVALRSRRATRGCGAKQRSRAEHRIPTNLGRGKSG
jgi:hypothetical protein